MRPSLRVSRINSNNALFCASVSCSVTSLAARPAGKMVPMRQCVTFSAIRNSLNSCSLGNKAGVIHVITSYLTDGSRTIMRIAFNARSKLSGWPRRALCSASKPSRLTDMLCRPERSSPSKRFRSSRIPFVTNPHG